MSARRAQDSPLLSAGRIGCTLAAFPDLTLLHQLRPERYPHLLESVAHGAAQARYDILFAFPQQTLALTAADLLTGNGGDHGRGDFLEAFERDWRREAARVGAAGGDELPFTGGWFVFLGYETAAQIEPRLAGIARDPTLPVACATRFPAAIIRDHARRLTHLVCEPGGAREWLAPMQADLRALRAPPAAPPPAAAEIAEDEPADFIRGVERVQEYIAAGDVYQVNLSRAWRARLRAPAAAADLYRRLRAANPAPFAGLMTFPGGRAVISSSPERLVEVRAGTARTRPIAGTYPRSADPVRDQALARALLLHPKERAEHVMLIDLERNDLGRICRTGTVTAAEFMTLESYRHVHHIVSEVRGELRPGITPAQVLRAVFPGGTITGCPKLRCMQIIAELERGPRGAYTGSMGYINHDGSMDLNILIRTLVQNGDEVSLRAGAGIVADSVPQRELEETRAKARGLLAALGIAA